MSKLKTWIDMYGLKNVVFKTLNQSLPFNRIADNSLLRRMNWQEKCKKKLKKHLIISNSTTMGETESNIIWWLWFQGLDQAPAIVKKCRESVDAFALTQGMKVVELTSDSLETYIEIPSNIKTRFETGQMPAAMFSDFCRVSLLAKYGGLWIDSTVLVTDEIDSDILTQDIFMFQSSPLDLSITKVSNWFMFSRYPNHPFILSLRDSLVSFYEKQKKIPDYFIFHLLVACLIDDDRVNQSFFNMSFYSNTYPHLLGASLNQCFDDRKWNTIMKKSTIHKLSYKNLDESLTHSFYKHILQMDF